SSSAQRARRSRTWPWANSGTHLNAEIVIMRYAPLRFSWRRLKLAEGFAPADHMAVATLGSAADVWSRRAPFDYKKMTFQLIERSGPAFLVSAATLLVVQAGVCECEFGTVGIGAMTDLAK